MSSEITQAVEPLAAPPARCKIEDVFGGPFIELLTLAPKNPVVRGLILAQTRQLPGPDCDTFAQLKEWAETTCRPRPRAGGGDLAKVPTPARGIKITVEFSETEYGRANYSVDRSGNDEFELDEDELLEFVRDAIEDGEGLDDVIEKIVNLIEEDAWSRCSPDLDAYGEYNYDEHESNDSANGNVECTKSQIRERLRTFLRESHPQLLEELV